MLIDLIRDVLPKEGDIVTNDTNIIIKYILRNYDHYPLLRQHEKYNIEENINIDTMSHHVPKYMYGLVKEEHNVPHKLDTFAKCKVDWAVEFHFKNIDSLK